MAHPNFNGGAYSRYIQVLSPETAKRYKAMQTSEDYLSLAPDIFAVQMRIEELVLRARSGETPKSWQKARQAFDRFMTAQEASDRVAGVAALSELRAVLHAGDAEREAWNEVQQLWTKLQRLVESERRRAIEHGELVQVAIVLNILRTGADAFRRHLAYAQIDNATRDTILSRISIDLDRITGGAISGLAIAGKSGAPK